MSAVRRHPARRTAARVMLAYVLRCRRTAYAQCAPHKTAPLPSRRVRNFSFPKKVSIFKPNLRHTKMIVKLVSKYLAEHKRLVIPNLGTFIVKVPGQTVLFSNLIKADDGVLRSLIAQSGVSEMEAAAMMDRFVFEAQYRLQNNGKCRLSGFGELRSGANGTITFVYEPTADAPVAETAVRAARDESAPDEDNGAAVPTPPRRTSNRERRATSGGQSPTSPPRSRRRHAPSANAGVRPSVPRRFTTTNAPHRSRRRATPIT